MTADRPLAPTPLPRRALAARWTPRVLAEAAGGNTGGVRNAYAALAARLSPAGLPAPPARAVRPPCCGLCDERTRMLDFDGEAPAPCRRCKRRRETAAGPAPTPSRSLPPRPSRRAGRSA